MLIEGHKDAQIDRQVDVYIMDKNTNLYFLHQQIKESVILSDRVVFVPNNRTNFVEDSLQTNTPL
jgi:hypothetical protein